MGFGILLLGYPLILSVTLSALGLSFELLGYLIMYRALTLLSEYGASFRDAKYTVAALIPLGVFCLGRQALSWFGAAALYEAVNRVSSLAYTILLAVGLLIFHIFLLRAVRILALEVELPRLAVEAKRNMVVTCLYFMAALASSFMNVKAVTDQIPYHKLLGAVSIFGVIWILLNAKMIFICYARICLPGDEDMPIGDRKLPRLFGHRRDAEKTPEEIAAEEKARRERERAAYDAEMKRRQAEKTKKNKRGKRR